MATRICALGDVLSIFMLATPEEPQDLQDADDDQVPGLLIRNGMTGQLLSANSQDVYDLIDFLSGEVIAPDKRQKSADELKWCLLHQHPRLASIDTSDLTPDNCQKWLAAQEVKLGKKQLKVDGWGL